jgi:hypothetical protein
MDTLAAAPAQRRPADGYLAVVRAVESVYVPQGFRWWFSAASVPCATLRGSACQPAFDHHPLSTHRTQVPMSRHHLQRCQGYGEQ